MTADHEHLDANPSSRRRLVVIGVVVVIAIVAAALLISRCGSSSSTTATGSKSEDSRRPVETVTIEKVGMVIVITKALAIVLGSGTDCWGWGAQRDVKPGATVTVRSLDGESLATSTYGVGVFAPTGMGRCTIATTTPMVVPKADAYLIDGPGYPTGGARVTAAELAASGWSYIPEIESR